MLKKMRKFGTAPGSPAIIEKQDWHTALPEFMYSDRSVKNISQ